MFDFTKLRESTVKNPGFAKSFWQTMLDVIANDIGKKKGSKKCDCFQFTYDENSIPNNANLFGVFNEYSLKVEGEYFFNGELRVRICAQYPEDSADTVIFKYEAFEEFLTDALEKNGFKWNDATWRYIININSSKT